MRRMHDWERGITFLALALFVAMGVYPPWARTAVIKVSAQHPEQKFALSPGHASSYTWVWGDSAQASGDYVDYPRLFLQWGMLGVCYLAWYFWPKLETKHDEGTTAC